MVILGMKKEVKKSKQVGDDGGYECDEKAPQQCNRL